MQGQVLMLETGCAFGTKWLWFDVVSKKWMSWGVLAYCNKICKLGGLWWMLTLVWNTLLYVVRCDSDGS